MRTLTFTFMLIIFLSCLSMAQDFGDISDEELEMTSFENDPDADAVVLFDKGTLRITNDFMLEISRHVRIKILTEEGKENADVKIKYWYEDDFYDLEAASYSPEGEEFELDSDNIFEEESGKWNSVSFALPGVKVGSVIEYEYTIYSDYITNLQPWYFQGKNYTLLSELNITVPHGFTYNTLKSNFDLFGL